MCGDNARSRKTRVSLTPQSAMPTQERAEFDAAFAGMGEDAAYQSEARMIAAEFSEADWESLQIGEDADMP